MQEHFKNQPPVNGVLYYMVELSKQFKEENPLLVDKDSVRTRIVQTRVDELPTLAEEYEFVRMATDAVPLLKKRI